MRLLPALAALLALAACTADPGPLPEKPAATVAVTFSSSFARTPSALTWTWTVRNDEPGEIAVLSGSAADTEGGLSNAPVAWVVPRDDATIEVSQRLFSQPPRVGLARPYSQFGTVLPAGGTLSGSASVPLPLTVSHPYATFFDPPMKLPPDASEVIFCLGVARSSDVPPEPSASPSFAPTPDGSAPAGARKARFVHTAGERQHLACAPPEDLP